MSIKSSRLTEESLSTTEACGFVTYCLCLPIGLLSIFWAIVPEHTFNNFDITYYPPKSLAVVIPTLTIIGIFSIPVGYAFLNYLSSPSYTSSYTIWDSHSSEQSLEKSSNKTAAKSIAPAFCDLDVAFINSLSEAAK